MPHKPASESITAAAVLVRNASRMYNRLPGNVSPAYLVLTYCEQWNAQFGNSCLSRSTTIINCTFFFLVIQRIFYINCSNVDRLLNAIGVARNICSRTGLKKHMNRVSVERSVHGCGPTLSPRKWINPFTAHSSVVLEYLFASTQASPVRKTNWTHIKICYPLSFIY